MATVKIDTSLRERQNEKEKDKAYDLVGSSTGGSRSGSGP